MRKENTLPDIFVAMLLMVLTFAPAEASEFIQKGVVLQPGTAEEGLEFIPSTGNYILTYKTQTISGNEMLYQIEFIPATKIDPKIKSRFKETSSGVIRYIYKIKNGKKARQNIDSIMVMTSNIDDASVVGPEGWRAGAYRITRDTKSDGSETRIVGTNVAWSDTKQGKAGIAPGVTIKGYSFESNDLPGVGVVKLDGKVGKVMGYAGEGPQGEVGEQFEELRANNFVPRYATTPMIHVADPFDAAAVLGDIQRHINMELVKFEQISPVFAAQLDRYFLTAIAGVNNGNLVAARSDIKEIRRLVNIERRASGKDNKDNNKGNGLITRLASSVLIFNLKYVEKRLKHASD